MNAIRRQPWLADELALFRAQMRERRTTRKALGEDPVLVYQMGKVASQTVVHTLLAVGSFRRPILHVHYLRLERLRQIISIFRSARRSTRGTSIPIGRITPSFAWRGLEVARAMARRQGDQWTVITLVRDPVARDISAFFQNLRGVLGFDLRKWLGRASPEAIVEEIRPTFDRYFIDSAIDPVVNAGLSWFDDELKSVLDVDVYESPFPHELGYQILQEKRARVLVLRAEDLNRVGPTALTGFLDHEVAQLVHANVAESRAYKEVSQAFKRLEFPGHYLDRCYGSKLARHFYTPAEIEAFRAQWRT